MIKHILLTLALITASWQATAQEAPIREPEKPFLNIQTVTSKSGITAWLVEDHSLPIIAIEFGFKNAGAAQDPQNRQGLARIMSNTMDEGAGEITARDFQKALTDNSITLSYGVSRDHFTGSFKTLRRHKDKAFNLLKLSLTQPRFDDEPLARMIAANQSRIRSSLSNPEWIAARIMNNMAYEGHPYAKNSGGTLSSLTKITPDELRTYHKKALAQDNLVIAVTGAITPEELSTQIDTIFASLPAKNTLKNIKPLEQQNQSQIWLHEKDIPQTIIEITQPGIARDDPKYYTAQIMNFILGSSGFGSRLTRTIREENGLTYGIYTRLSTANHFNGLTLSTSTQNDTAEQMLDLIRAEWTKMKDHPVTPEELEAAQNYLIGSVPLSLTSTSRIAGLMLSFQLDGLPVSYLDNRAKALSETTIEDITALSSQLLDINAMSIVMVGKPASIAADKLITEIPDAE